MPAYISRLPDARPSDRPLGLVILGATGSIGASALHIVADHPETMRVVALAGGRNVRRLAELAQRFRPDYLAVLDQAGVHELRGLLSDGYNPQILGGPQAFQELATLPQADMILSAIVGAAGLPPTWAAVRAGKVVALANKESLVLAGGLIRAACAQSGAVILPVDSEHNALFQVVSGEHPKDIRRLILTASGGPFRGKTAADLRGVTKEQALNHPNWSMGAKITVDSATLMNKGLEVIEACHLFGVDEADVATVVHPQSLVHSLAEFHDGSLLAHLGPPDMRVAIAHCLAFPRRLPLRLAPVDLVAVGSLTFTAPDLEAFPCLRLAREAWRAGQGHPVVLNAANEVAVDHFLRDHLPFWRIPAVIEEQLVSHNGHPVDSLEAILALDQEVRQRTTTHIARIRP